MIKLLLITLVFLAIALLAMGIRILLKRGGMFPETHVSQNINMREKGVHCYKTQDKVEQVKVKTQCQSLNSEFGCACSDNTCAS